MPFDNVSNIETLLAHRPPILMLNKLISCSNDNSHGIARVPERGPYQDTGILPRVFFVEIIGQLIAASQAYNSLSASAAAISSGYLVGVRQFKFYNESLAGDFLDIHCTRMNSLENLEIVHGCIARGSEILAEGEVRCFRTSSLPLADDITDADPDKHRTSLNDTLSTCMSIFCMDSAAGIVKASVSIGPDSSVFEGHFPGYPIVPGIVWIEAAFHLASKLLARRTVVTKISFARFKRPVRPTQTVNLEVVIKREASAMTAASRLTLENALLASFELSLELI
jgi:3-hydroxyacyl-[acyl-carrier-protein] dehydratase